MKLYQRTAGGADMRDRPVRDPRLGSTSGGYGSPAGRRPGPRGARPRIVIERFPLTQAGWELAWERAGQAPPGSGLLGVVRGERYG